MGVSLFRRMILLCCVVLAGAACGSEQRGAVDEGTRVVVRTVTETVERPSEPQTTEKTTPPEETTEAVETPTETAEAPIEASPDLLVGDTAVTAAGNEITVHSYEYVPPSDIWQPEPGFRFAAIDVEGCAAPDLEGSAGLNPFDFSLQMPDNTRLETDIGVKEPTLNDTTLPPGDCVRGWVTYQVPEGQTPTSVIFTASSIIKWAVQGTEAGSAQTPPEEVLALQYQYLNMGDYEAAYDLFTEQSKQLVSPEQYRAYFENAGYYEITNYSFPSVQIEGDTVTLVADLSVSSGIAGDEQYQRTQQLALEELGWRVVMRDEQVALFTGSG